MKYILFALTLLFAVSCSNSGKQINNTNKKIGVLIISHGSQSANWRKMLIAVEDSVKNQIISGNKISGIKSAFMEYNEPSIASCMQEFDNEGYSDVIVVPMLLTVSTHSFDDIPTILGQKSDKAEIDQLTQEGIKIYKPKANIYITPLLDFPKILAENITNRAKALSKNPQNEACVLVAYGSEEYNDEWTALMKEMIMTVDAKLGMKNSTYSWCGHIAGYSPELTTKAINEVMKNGKNPIVIPVLVAVDELFQGKLITGAIDASKDKQRVIYKPDSILPDKNVQNWVISISNKFADSLLTK